MTLRKWIGTTAVVCLMVVSAGCAKKQSPPSAPQKPAQPPAQSTQTPSAPIPQPAPAPTETAAPAKPVEAVKSIEADKPSVVVVNDKPADSPSVVTAVAQSAEPEKPILIADDAWTQDYDAASRKATAENKDLLINFTGSDWCPWCIKLDEEVFGKEEFKKAAGKSFVLVTLDFPRDTAKLTPAMQARNQKLQTRYGVQGYPTILLTDGRGRPYAQTAYKEGGPDKYLEHLTTLQQVGRKIRELFAAAEKSDTPPADRAKLYDQGLSQLPQNIMTEFFQTEIDKIIELDSQNQAGLKNKYLLIRQFNRIQAALDSKNYAGARDIIDAAVETLKPTGADAQNLYFARAQAMHYLSDPAGEKDSLQKAFDSAPDSEAATQIRRILDIYFPKPPATARPAKIQTNLKTYQTFLPERAFDGNPDSYFWAAGEAKSGDQLTIILDQPAALQEIRVLTGSEQVQQGRLYEGVVEVSDNGQKFDAVGEFRDGIGFAKLNGRTVKAVRIRCTKNQTEWLVVREFELK